METLDDAVAEKKAELDWLRPMSAKGLSALAAWYDVELTYISNAIEGTTLTRSGNRDRAGKGNHGWRQTAPGPRSSPGD